FATILSSSPYLCQWCMDQPAVTMLHFLPEAHNRGSRHSVAASFVDQRGVSPGRSGGAIAGFNRAHQRTVIYPGTQALTSDQVQAATELYTEHSHSSVDAVTVHELLVTMNMLPPPGFIVQDALESIGQPLDRVSLDGFLSVVNGVWKAAEDLTSHDMIVRHAYEAFAQAREKKKQRSENGSADSSTDDDDSPIPVVGGGGTKLLMAAKHSHPTGKQATSSSKTSDPVLLIVKSNMNRGLRNLQQFLSPSQGEPEMLRSFINLGAVDNGAGYMLDMARMSQKCADVGITTKDMSTITKIFDPTNSGELDYDEYLQLMRCDLEKLGLKSKLLTQLRRVLFQKPASSSSAAAAATSVIVTAATSTAPLVTVSSASISSPSSPAAAPSGGALGVSAVTAAFNSPLRRRASGHRFSAAPQYSNVDAFETPIAATLAPLSETLSGSGAEEGDNDDPLTGDLGKSFFHSIAARQASIHEFSGNGPNLFLPVLPMEFFNEMHQNLEQCRVELEGLREYEIEAQNLKLYGTRRPRGAQRYQTDSAVGASGGAASPRKQSLNATVVSVTSSALGQTHHNLTKTHSTSQLAVAAQQTSSEMESTTVLPRIDSTRRRSDVNSDGQLGGEGGVSQAPNSGRRYGAGHNPAIPKYQYGVPPLPLIHWSPRSGRMSNHKPTKSGEDDSVTVNQNSTLTPTEQQLSRANSGSSARSGGGGGGSRHATPRTQSQLLQQQHGSTLLESYYSFQQLLSPQVTPRSQVVAACGYAPTPLQPLRRHPVAPPPRTSNRTPEVPSPTAAQQQLKSPKHAVIRQNSPPLMAASGSGRPGAERLNTPPGGEGIAHHLEIKQSIYRLAGVDAAIEALVSPMSPLSPHQQTEISGPQSPRNYPESPQHRGRRTVSSAAIRALARASSMNGTLSSSHGGGGTSPRHINGSRSSSKKKLVRSPSTNRMLVAAAIADEDLITDVDAAPAAIGGMMGREEKIKTELFEKDLMAGNPNVLGKVSARLLKHQGSAVQAVYGHHVPRTTAQALLPKPPPRRNDPTVNSAQAPPVKPKDSGEGDQEVAIVSTES
ncbi:Hypothetical protein, putative, partial [Bodo saltans]